jgi:hypothetical protein
MDVAALVLHEPVQLPAQEGRDGEAFVGGQDAGFLEGLLVEGEGDVAGHDFT